MLATLLCMIPMAFIGYEANHVIKLCELGKVQEAKMMAESSVNRSKLGLGEFVEATMVHGYVCYKTGDFDAFYGDFYQVQNILNCIDAQDKAIITTHVLYQEMVSLYEIAKRSQEERVLEHGEREHKHHHHHHHEESSNTQSELEHNP